MSAEPAATSPAPRERPVLFSGPNVLKILAGTKTQTRRVVKWKPREEGINLGFSGLEVGFYFSGRPDSGWVLRSRDGAMRWNDRTHPLHCPYGRSGDRLWVREAWMDLGDGRFDYRATTEDGPGRWRPSIHMPRSASRLTLEITRVRIERLQGIGEEDATAEGVTLGMTDAPPAYPPRRTEHQYKVRETPVQAFARSWNGLHGNGAWQRNDWVWAITFTRLP